MNDQQIEPYEILPLQVRVDIGLMTMQGRSGFLKVLRLKSLYHM